MGPIKDRNGLDLTEAENIKKRWQEYRKTIQKNIFMTQITTKVCSLTQSQTSWSVKSSGPSEGSLRTKLMELMEFQLSYFKS